MPIDANTVTWIEYADRVLGGMQMSEQTTINRETLSSRVALRLRDEILAGELKPGERLNEIGIAERYGVSPTPVREAMRLLRGDGLVEYADRKGMRVIELTERQITQAFSVRTAIEHLALEEAIPLMGRADKERLVELAESAEEARGAPASLLFELDRRFHAYFVDFSQNLWLSEFSGRIANVLTVARLDLFKAPDLDSVITEHVAIANAVLEDDLDKAHRELDKHIKRVCANAIAAHARILRHPDGAGKDPS